MSPRCRRMLVAWNAVKPGAGALMVARNRVPHRTAAAVDLGSRRQGGPPAPGRGKKGSEPFCE
jgi:hypothetical protein